MFGVNAADAGWGSLAPIVMSMVVFAGSAQFALLSVLSDGGTLIAALAAAVLINMRFLVMGIALAPSLVGRTGAPGARGPDRSSTPRSCSPPTATARSPGAA